MLRPAHFRDVQQSLNTRCNFNESTIISYNNNLSFDSSSLNEVFRHRIPWVSCQLFHTKRNSSLVVIKIENNHIQLLIQFDQFFRVIHAAPRHIRDVDQSIDATQINKHTVRSDVFDGAFQDLSFFEATNNDSFLLLKFSFN